MLCLMIGKFQKNCMHYISENKMPKLISLPAAAYEPLYCIRRVWQKAW